MMLLPPDKVRMGAGLINIMQQGIGGTVGLAMMTTMLERHTVLMGVCWHSSKSPHHSGGRTLSRLCAP